LKLYSHYRSSAAYRVRIALNLKGVTAEIIPIDLGKREHHAPKFLEVNPQGLLPALDTGHGVLTQSSAILEWLEETRKEPPLLPEDAWARAQVRAMCAIVGSDIHPVQNRRVLSYLKHEFDADQDAIFKWARTWITAGFDALERLVDQAPGKYAFGDTPTLADIYLMPQVYNARQYGVDVDKFPNIAKVEQACASIDAFAIAHPRKQPDAPAG